VAGGEKKKAFSFSNLLEIKNFERAKLKISEAERPNRSPVRGISGGLFGIW
jgi:hypothetical protein